MKSSTTRRSLLKAAPAAAIAFAIPTTAAATAANRSAWDAAMRAYEKAKADSDAFDPVYERIWEAYEAGRPSMDNIHWREFWPASHHQRGREEVARVIDLDRRWQDFLAGEGKWWWAQEPEKRKAEFRRAIDSVQAFRDAEASHEHDSGFRAADKKWNDLVDATVERAWELMAMPAPDLAALHWKLDYIKEGSNFASYEADALAPLMADIARLLPEGA